MGKYKINESKLKREARSKTPTVSTINWKTEALRIKKIGKKPLK